MQVLGISNSAFQMPKGRVKCKPTGSFCAMTPRPEGARGLAHVHCFMLTMKLVSGSMQKLDFKRLLPSPIQTLSRQRKQNLPVTRRKSTT